VVGRVGRWIGGGSTLKVRDQPGEAISKRHRQSLVSQTTKDKSRKKGAKTSLSNLGTQSPSKV